MDVCATIERETGQAVTAETELDALELDSLEFLDLLLVMAEAAGKPVPFEAAAKWKTVGDLAREFAQ